MPRHPHPQRPGNDPAADRDREDERLAVDPDRNMASLGRHNHLARGQHPQPGRVAAAQQADRLGGTGDVDRDHAEQAAVEPGAAPEACDVAGLVGVGRHQQRLRGDDRLAVGDGREPGAAVPLEQVREGVEGGAELVVAVRGGLDDLGVGAERDVVDERLTADLAQVDPQFDRVCEGVQAGGRVRPVQPRSSAKWLRVPAVITRNGRPCSAATPATSAWVPSPPATPSRSAPSATACRATAATST